MFGLGTSELLLILVIVLIIFGAGKLPEVGAALGRGVKNFKEGVKGPDDDKKGQKQVEGGKDDKQV